MNGRRRVLAVAAVGAALALVTVNRVSAKAPPGCDADAEKFCHGVPSGAGRVLSCLQEHASQLTPECTQALETVKKHVERRGARQTGAQWVGPCTGDIQKLCKGVPAGAGRIAECLAQHQAELSAGCKAVFPPKGNR